MEAVEAVVVVYGIGVNSGSHVDMVICEVAMLLQQGKALQREGQRALLP